MIFSDVIEIETVVVLLVTLGRICAATQDICITIEIKNLVFDILLPKSKPMTTGVFYRPPNQADFMNLMVEKCSNLNLKDNEIYPLGDANINLFNSGNSILNRNRTTTSQGSVHTLIFCQISNVTL